MNDYRRSLRKIRARAVADEDGSVTLMPTHTLDTDRLPFSRTDASCQWLVFTGTQHNGIIIDWSLQPLLHAVMVISSTQAVRSKDSLSVGWEGQRLFAPQSGLKKLRHHDGKPQSQFFAFLSCVWKRKSHRV